MKFFLISIIALMFTSLAIAQTQVTKNISATITGLVWDDNTNQYYLNSNGSQIGQEYQYHDYVQCVIDLGKALGGLVTAVSSGSITIQLDGVNTGVQWTANYIGDVSNQSYQTQVNAIKALNSPWISIPGSITLPIDYNHIYNNKITIGAWKSGTFQSVVSCSGSITATIDRPVTLNVTYNQGSGNIIAYIGAYNAPPTPAVVSGYEQNQITIGALTPTIPNYTLIYNENQAPLNKSAWWIYDQNRNKQNLTLIPDSNTFSMQYSQNNWTYEAQMKKLCNITIQNNFIGVGHGNTITVNNNLVSSPSSNNMVVEQNAITGLADNNVIVINGIYYYFNNWTDVNNTVITNNNSATFDPTTNMTYNANFTGYPFYNINFGYNNTVNQPIQMYWTDNPNPNVTYQIWRNIKGSSGPVILATIGRGVQTYTDYDYLYTSTYTNDLLYYDVREYYSVESTYSNPTWHAVYGKISPKETPNQNLTLSTESENITSYFVSCYPNPFNPTTIISYQLPKAGAVTLKIYDSMGREIKTLVNETKDKGSYNVSFNASSLPSGVYFYQLRSGDYISTKKMVLLK